MQFSATEMEVLKIRGNNENADKPLSSTAEGKAEKDQNDNSANSQLFHLALAASDITGFPNDIIIKSPTTYLDNF